MPSYASLREEVVGYLTARFGIGGPELERLLFLERGGEVWAATCRAPETLSLARPEGLRALRRVEGGWKPTSALLEVLGRSITAARLEVEGVDELVRAPPRAGDPDFDEFRLRRHQFPR